MTREINTSSRRPLRPRRLAIVAALVTGLAVAPAAIALARTIGHPAGTLPQNQQYSFTFPGTTCNVTYVYGNYASRGYSSIRMNSGNCTRVTTRATNSNGQSYWKRTAATTTFGSWAQATPSAGSIINAEFCVLADNGNVRNKFAVNAFGGGAGNYETLGGCGS